MNNCQRIENVFKTAGKLTLTHSELLSALRESFPAIKDFLIADHYENNKRDAAGNPIGGAAGSGSSCAHKPNGCMVRVAPKTYRIAMGFVEGGGVSSQYGENASGPSSMRNVLAAKAAIHEEKIAAFCTDHLDLRYAKLGDEYYYASLALCVIDAVYSIGVRYEGVQNVVQRYCSYFRLPRFRQNREQLPTKSEQQPLSFLVGNMAKVGIDKFTREIFQNSQRTSARAGILKSDAVLRFARVLRDYRIDFFQDIPPKAADPNLERRLSGVPGQASGISIGYFFMLAGDDNLIKPDRHIMSFLQRCLGRACTVNEAKALLSGACEVLQPQYPHLTPRLLDNVIWNHERSR